MLLNRIFVSSFLTASLFLTAIAHAQEKKETKNQASSAQSEKKVNAGKTKFFDYTHTFYREKKLKDQNGKVEVKREYVESTLPGEELVAVATYTYKQAKPANEVVFTLPLPKETIYVEGSATDEKYVWFSVDGGKNWSRFRNLRVIDKDGTKRIATGKDVTHLQWRMASNLKPGDTGKLEYRVVIR